MLELIGKFATAKVFTNAVEESAAAQITDMCNQPVFENSKIRIMPDVHAGFGSTVGTTVAISDKVPVGLVGGDIGCGMEVAIIKEKRIEPQKLDKVVQTMIPSGTRIRKKAHRYNNDIDISQMFCYEHIDRRGVELSLGTLGSGNHFIEADKGEDGQIYIVIHSGSRHLGAVVAKYYQETAYKTLKEEVPYYYAYCEGSLLEMYLHDMKIVQEFARLNRAAMLSDIAKEMGLHIKDSFATVHNYIDAESMILRKGAVSAKLGELLIIPINMRDGALICTGKGNEDWNVSAPHGAGRLMSRSKAKENFTVSDFKKEMKGIYTTSINSDTLDECPMAYKSMSDIVDNIGETVEVNEVIKPIYNFKAGGE